MHDLDSIVAPATPTGESALAVIRTSGPLANQLAARCHHGTVPTPRMAWHGDYVATDGVALDDVIYTFFAAPKSYTGEDSLEISCHGNPLIVSRIVRDLARFGFRLAEPGEFTKRSFLNGRLDLTEAEAVMDLIRARSDRALESARSQLRGSLRQHLDQQIDRLLDLCATVEAHVDFPEEDLPETDRQAWSAEVAALTTELRALAATRREGDRIRQGVKVVLAGEPNAGKSSLLNRLVGFERAIVSPEPGTTRDFLEEPIQLAGQSVRIFDTAGLRESSTGVERIGVERTLDRLKEADIIVLIADGIASPPQLPENVAAMLRGENVLVVANKSDLGLRKWDHLPTLPFQPLEVSALTNAGLDDFRSALSEKVARLCETSGAFDGLVVNARHEQSLNEAVVCLDRARDILASNPRTDLAAVDIRLAIDAMGAIVGRIEHDVILDRVFSSFCIGK